MITKAEEDIAKTEADLRSPNPVWLQAGLAAVASASNLAALIGRAARMDPKIYLPRKQISPRTCPHGVTWGNRSNFTRGRSRGLSSAKRGSFRGKNKPNKWQLLLDKPTMCSSLVQRSKVKDARLWSVMTVYITDLFIQKLKSECYSFYF